VSGPAEQAGAGPTAARITVLTRPGCHLCEDALVVVARVADDLGVDWREVDISTDEDLLAQWWEQIPVTFVDGVQHDYWRVDEARLRAALAR
jgi:glutaredoxin